MGDEQVASTDELKRRLREEMRSVRRSLTDRPERSRELFARVQQRQDVQVASKVMAFTSIPSEPDTAPFLAWCAAQGKVTAVPEDEVDASWPDVILVPGLAFTTGGDRCGQGGGWYDRFLTARRADCTTIGVCFAPQIVSSLPLEAHDVRVDAVVTD